MVRAAVFQLANREDEGVQIWEQLRAENPDAIPPRLELAAHYQAADRHGEARALIQEALQVNPALSAGALSLEASTVNARIRRNTSATSRPPTCPESHGLYGSPAI